MYNLVLDNKFTGQLGKFSPGPVSGKQQNFSPGGTATHLQFPTLVRPEIFLTPCLNVQSRLSIEKRKYNNFLQFLFHMFTENNIDDTVSLDIRIAVQHQISFSHFRTTPVIYITVATIAFGRPFIFFISDVLTGSVC
jgi:hypothetical protein